MLNVTRTDTIIKPDATRVLLRPFNLGNPERVRKVFERVIALTDDMARKQLEATLHGFKTRHHSLEQRFRERFNQISQDVEITPERLSGLDATRQLLLGAYFSLEYAVESAALFNPSMVWHPDQTGVPAGSKRFVVSLRATGEGHISSIVFRSGVVDQYSNVAMDATSRFASSPTVATASDDESSTTVLFRADSQLSERVIFPALPEESNGIEDARFVQLENDSYYATYTAYDGHRIRLRLLQTEDFISFRIYNLHGREVQNKGMALFPRKIDGRFAMLSRQDNENLFIMFSDDLKRWDEKRLQLEPALPWEFIQLGNCGSPIETDAGWLVLTHGVGPVRKYTMGAILLDPDEPTRVIGRLQEPLLIANETEREGYVPNVVYSCGSQIHNGRLIIPYAMSDYASSFATVDLAELLGQLR